MAAVSTTLTRVRADAEQGHTSRNRFFAWLFADLLQKKQKTTRHSPSQWRACQALMDDSPAMEHATFIACLNAYRLQRYQQLEAKQRRFAEQSRGYMGSGAHWLYVLSCHCYVNGSTAELLAAHAELESLQQQVTCLESLMDDARYDSLVERCDEIATDLVFDPEAITALAVPSDKARFTPSDGVSARFYNNTSDNRARSAGFFSDVQAAMLGATHCILISGWSLHLQKPLAAQGDLESGALDSLGELLVKKAIDNPHMMIVIMVWSQNLVGKSMHHLGGHYLTQIAQYLGHETLPSNIVWRCDSADGMHSYHDKYVIVDDAVFCGSADLAQGRFDWSEHTLAAETHDAWSDYSAHEHKDGSMVRMPRHEMSVRVSGPVVKQFVQAFCVHWDGRSHAGSVRSFGTKNIKADVTRRIRGVSHAGLSEMKTDSGPWTAQVLTSTKKSYCEGPWPLSRDHESSIADGIKQAFRQVKTNGFIYIENQYFTAKQYEGSIYQALVVALTEKNAHAYIVLPVIPDSHYRTVKVGMLRYEQWQLMQTMMRDIEERTGHCWRETIHFFNLANWEGMDDDYYASLAEPGSKRADNQNKAHRESVYVHSKSIIVDDRIAIIGSANFSDRSLAGCRDTETATMFWPRVGFEAQCEHELGEFRQAVWQTYFGEACVDAIADVRLASAEAVSIIERQAQQNFVAMMGGSEARRPGQGMIVEPPLHRRHQVGLVGRLHPGLPKYIADTPLKDQESDSNVFRFFPKHPPHTKVVLDAGSAVGLGVRNIYQ